MTDDKIKHDLHGIREGVEVWAAEDGIPLSWCRIANDCFEIYYRKRGWSEVPEEEPAKEWVTIQHARWGEVEGVTYRDDLKGGTWILEKDARRTFFYADNGWSEVPEKQWVTIQVEKAGFERHSDILHKTKHTMAAIAWRYPA